MTKDWSPRQGASYLLTSAYQVAWSHGLMQTIHWPRGLGRRCMGGLSPGGSCASGRAWWVGYQVVGVVMSLLLPAVCAHAADTFTRLSAREIRATVIGHVVTDDTHWSQHFRPDGTLQSIVISQLRQGRWTIVANTLCLTLKTRREHTKECYEVWLWKDHVEYRDNGALVMTGFVRKEWR